MRTFPFPVHITPESTGGSAVTCPVLPGCHSRGETLEDATANIREAIELVLEDMAAYGEVTMGRGCFVPTFVPSVVGAQRRRTSPVTIDSRLRRDDA